MIRGLPRFLLFVVVILASGCFILLTTNVWSQDVPSPLKKATSSQRGTYLVDAKGMTLYVFDKDKEPGKSVCYGGCVKSWPPFALEAGQPEPVSPLSVITRDDGTKQYAYKGKPLYYYAKDSSPGDIKGDAVGKVWWIVKP